MRRTLITLVAFFILPLVLMASAWLPVLFGQLKVASAAATLHAAVLAIPTFALTGIWLSWLLRRHFFDKAWLPATCGLVAGALAGGVVFAFFPYPIVNPRPLYTTLPLLGAMCGAVASGIDRHLKSRSGQTTPKRFVYPIDRSQFPPWARPFVRIENLIRATDSRRLKDDCAKRHKRLGLICLVAAFVMFIALNHWFESAMGVDLIKWVKMSSDAIQGLFRFLVFFIALLGSVYVGWVLVSAMYLLISRASRDGKADDSARYVLLGQFPRQWLRDA